MLYLVRQPELAVADTEGAERPSYGRMSRLSSDLSRLEESVTTNPDPLDPHLATIRNMAFTAWQADDSIEQALDLYLQEEYGEARRLLEAASPSIAFGRGRDARNCLAITTLADLYNDGVGGPVSKHKAFQMYLKAAEVGDAEGQYRVARMYLDGVPGVVQGDSEKAIVWFERAASESAENPEMTSLRKYMLQRDNHKIIFQTASMNRLFNLYLKRDTSLGCHPVKALATLYEAAKYCPVAQSRLGAYLCVGPGQFADKRKAKIWLEKAISSDGQEDYSKVKFYTFRAIQLEVCKFMFSVDHWSS